MFWLCKNNEMLQLYKLLEIIKSVEISTHKTTAVVNFDNQRTACRVPVCWSKYTTYSSGKNNIETDHNFSKIRKKPWTSIVQSASHFVF